MSAVTAAGGRVDPREYAELDLRAHALLAGVPLHDVWAVDLPAGGTVADVHALLDFARLAEVNAAVKLLFTLRGWLGRAFAWDRERPRASETSFIHRIRDEDREKSLIPPGTLEGPFRVLYAFARESVSEVQNATVHAFSVLALVERGDAQRLYWAVYVRPVGRVTGWYMRLIDPFRRLIIYPAVLRHLRRAWVRA